MYCWGFKRTLAFLKCTVLTATFNSNTNRQISILHKIDTPEPADKNISFVDYVGKGNPYIEIGTDPYSGDF